MSGELLLLVSGLYYGGMMVERQCWEVGIVMGLHWAGR